MLSYLVPPVVAVFLMGIAWKRITATAAFLTLVIMQPLGVIMFIVIEINEAFPLQFLYAAGISLALSLLLLVGVSLVGAAPDMDKTDELTWKKKYWKEESDELRGKPILANYRVLSAVMLAATAGLVIWFA